MSTPELIINFINIKRRSGYYDSIEFLNKKYSIKGERLSIKIEKTNFNDFKEKIVVNLTVFPIDILSEAINYKINIFYGINRAYFFLTEDNEYLIEYNYIDNQKIFYKDLELNEYDGNGLVKRIVLINPPTFLKISNKSVTFSYTIKKLINDEHNSFEITDFDFEKSLFGVRVIQEEKKFSIISDMKKQKHKLENFVNDLKKYIDQNIEDKNKYEKLYEDHKNIEVIDLNFSQKKIVLNEEFQTNNDYYLMFLYWIWYSIKSSYIKKDYKCNYTIKEIFNNINKLYDLYSKDKDLKIYQKIMLFYSNVAFFLAQNDIKKYIATDLKYIKRKDIKNESVYKMSFDFLENFISKLNEKSYLFFPLLMLDCGDYNYSIDDEYIYGYNRESCDVIKSHLNELIPDIFFEYSEKGNIIEEESGFNYKYFGITFLNRLTIFKSLKKNPSLETYKNESEKRIFKHNGMLASKTLMHESFGHNKMIFNKKDKTISPSKFFDRKKRLVKMVSVTSHEKDDINNEIFKSLNGKSKGENGKFFEYFFGKYENNLIIDLLFQINDIGNLLDNVDYFVKDNLEDLQKYIINKYKITKNKKIKYDDKNLSFEDENKKMEEIIVKEEKINEIEKKENKEETSKNEIKDEAKENEKSENAFESKKDTIIFIEEDSNNINEEKKEMEEEEENLPFFIALKRP